MGGGGGVTFQDFIFLCEDHIRTLEDTVRASLLSTFNGDGSRKGYYCPANGRFYLSRPKRCDGYTRMTAGEYVEREVRRRLRHLHVRLEALRWLGENCSEALGVGGAFPESMLFFFDGGYLHVLGVDSPVVVVVLGSKTDSGRARRVLECLAGAPFTVDTYLDSLARGSPREILPLLG